MRLPFAVRGLTLIELMITLAVASILASTALPGLHGLLQNSRRTTLLNDLVSSVHLARNVSVLRGRTVVLCASLDGQRCSASGDAWNRGWIVFVNQDGEIGQRDPAAEPLLQAFTVDGAEQSVSLSVSGGGNVLRVRPFGRSSNGTFTICDDRGTAEARSVVVGTLGRPYVAKVDGSGRALQCG